ncbi:hypothetical protein [Rhizobium leguminosarum]|uniref:hypothetical protein n=1 Tax=Rhizobium leguminosarum TaxID=384 RepID=UPI00102F7DA9|nr:hypothetical protein [Rhizobium leguminosarum]TBG20523.1 hypothetical protein ELG81_08120 [Rhizobium leguminosarum]TBG46439.1 hypothetical protein ELG75_08135 [Rhizobium leguminosarum]TBG79410.1 hypothetical protein ELG76_08470 [Rhizobium leguminosarum]
MEDNEICARFAEALTKFIEFDVNERAVTGRLSGPRPTRNTTGLDLKVTRSGSSSPKNMAAWAGWFFLTSSCISGPR